MLETHRYRHPTRIVRRCDAGVRKNSPNLARDSTYQRPRRGGSRRLLPSEVATSATLPDRSYPRCPRGGPRRRGIHALVRDTLRTPLPTQSSRERSCTAVARASRSALHGLRSRASGSRRLPVCRVRNQVLASEFCLHSVEAVAPRELRPLLHPHQPFPRADRERPNEGLDPAGNSTPRQEGHFHSRRWSVLSRRPPAESPISLTPSPENATPLRCLHGAVDRRHGTKVLRAPFRARDRPSSKNLQRSSNRRTTPSSERRSKASSPAGTLPPSECTGIVQTRWSDSRSRSCFHRTPTRNWR